MSLLCGLVQHPHHLGQLATITIVAHPAPWLPIALTIALLKHEPPTKRILEQLLRPRRQLRAAHRAGLADAERPQLLHALAVVHVGARQGLRWGLREGVEADRALRFFSCCYAAR